jgi:two-component system chemotaxis response regulator CheB
MTDSEHQARDVVVVGSSAGGVQALRTLLRGLDPDFPGVVAIVLHRSPFHVDTLAQVIADGSAHRVREPRDGETIEFGNVYLAPRDRHLRIHDRTFRLDRGPKEHFTRPAIDALFRSAAEAYGPRVLGVLLTGGGRDGASGLIAIKRAGGMTIVQDPRDADCPAMPSHAIGLDTPNLVLPLDRIADTVVACMDGRPDQQRHPKPARS